MLNDPTDILRIEAPVVTVNQNLNLACHHDNEGYVQPFRFGRNTITASPVGAKVEVMFENLEHQLVNQINKYSYVVGCVAWLTNEKILRALTKDKQVSILINKEDFLRPDRGTWSQKKVKALYDAIPPFYRDTFCRGRGFNYPRHTEVEGDDTLSAAIRCVGVHADSKTIAPRMHNKFLVFCEYETVWETVDITKDPWEGLPSLPGDEWVFDPNAPTTRSYHMLVPKAVWTGSFNFTFNATQSLENAVLITDDTIAGAFRDEWESILGISQPLDWTSPNVAPEYVIGNPYG